MEGVYIIEDITWKLKANTKVYRKGAIKPKPQQNQVEKGDTQKKVILPVNGEAPYIERARLGNECRKGDAISCTKLAGIQRNRLNWAELDWIEEQACKIRKQKHCELNKDRQMREEKAEIVRRQYQGICSKGRSLECSTLIKTEIESSTEGSKERAIKLLRPFCMREHPDSCGLIGQLLILSNQRKEGIEMLQMACQWKDIESCEWLKDAESEKEDKIERNQSNSQVKQNSSVTNYIKPSSDNNREGYDF